MSDGIYAEVPQKGGQCAHPFNKLSPSACEQPVTVTVAGRRVDRAKVPALADRPAGKGTLRLIQERWSRLPHMCHLEPVWPEGKGLETGVWSSLFSTV